MSQLRKRGQRSESLAWDTLQDESISYAAQGILTYVLSLPPGWNFSADRIARARRKEGKDTVLKALRELEFAGYRKVTTERDERGRIRTYADFSYTPVPEWIEAAKRRAAKKKLQKKPGPKAMGSAAKQAALESLKGSDAHETEFPQVAPEVGIPDSGALDSGQPAETDVSAGRTGSGDTGIRSAGLLRGDNPESKTTTPRARETTSAAEPEAVTDVCVTEAENTSTTPDPRGVAVIAAVVPEAARSNYRTPDLATDAARAVALLDAGWTTKTLADAITASLSRPINGATTYPARWVRGALDIVEVRPSPAQAEAERRAQAATRQAEAERRAQQRASAETARAAMSAARADVASRPRVDGRRVPIRRHDAPEPAPVDEAATRAAAAEQQAALAAALASMEDGTVAPEPAR